MTLTKSQKQNLIAEFCDKLGRCKAAVITNYQGLKVTDINDLRKKLKEKGIDYKVVKNSLAKIALKEKGIKIDEAILDNPVAIAFGYNDEVEPNKIVYQFTKTNDKLGILGAVVNGKFVTANTIKSLALMPSREGLYAKMVGSIAAPLSGIVNVLGGNLRGLVSVLKQYYNQKKV